MGGHLLEDVATRGDPPPRAPGRGRRRGAARVPLGVALAVSPAGDPAARRRRAFEDSEGGAAMIVTALRALGGALGGVPQLNLWVRTAPRGTEEFCWHIEILPRLTVRAGFELGTGVDIDTSTRPSARRPTCARRSPEFESWQGRPRSGRWRSSASGRSPSPICSSSAPTTARSSTRARSTAARSPPSTGGSRPIIC